MGAVVGGEDGPAHGAEAADEERAGEADDEVVGAVPGDEMLLPPLLFLLHAAEADEGGHLVGVAADGFVHRFELRDVGAIGAARHADQAGAELIADEGRSVMTTMAQGSTGLGPAVVAPVLALHSVLLEKSEVPVFIEFDDDRPVPAEIVVEGGFDPATLLRPRFAAAELDGVPETVPLLALAWGRSGDKADMFNVGIIARDPEWLPWISAALTEQRVAHWFRGTTRDGTPPPVRRFDAPGFHCINFTVANALGGGQTAGMRFDPNAKGMAQRLLAMPIAVPGAIAARARPLLERLGHRVPEFAA